MDFAKIIATLEKGVKFVETMTPIAVEVGGPIVGNISKTVLTVTEITHNILARAAEAKQVIDDKDQEVINGLINRLAIQNDKLAEYILKS